MIIHARKPGIKRILFYILIFIAISLNGQEKLKIGNTKLSSKPLKVDNYNCIITPSISAQSSGMLTLLFKVEWFDKNNSIISKPEKISLVFKYMANVDDYCKKNNMKLSTKSGLLGRTKKLQNSISFDPADVLEISPYSNIFLE